MKENKHFFKRLSGPVFYLCVLFEIIISFVILICIGIELVTMINTYEVFSADFSTVQLRVMLSDIMWLVIGLEFIKMLLEHSQGAVLEVMLFAIARQMLLEHGMFDSLIAVVAIAGIFAIRKFLYDKGTDRQSVLAEFMEMWKREKKKDGDPNEVVETTLEDMSERG